jgi:hypothetical protein
MDDRVTLYGLLRAAMQDSEPRPKGVTREQHAMAVIAKLAGEALQYEEGRRAGLAADQMRRLEEVEANTRYWILAPYLGLRTSVLRGQEQAFCDWCGVKRRDWNAFAEGKAAEAGEWRADTVLPRIGAQLVQPFHPQATWLKEWAGRAPEQETLTRVTKALVVVDWTKRTFNDTLAFAAECRKGPTVAVMAAPERA